LALLVENTDRTLVIRYLLVFQPLGSFAEGLIELKLADPQLGITTILHIQQQRVRPDQSTRYEAHLPARSGIPECAVKAKLFLTDTLPTRALGREDLDLVGVARVPRRVGSPKSDGTERDLFLEVDRDPGRAILKAGHPELFTIFQ
jgi:hypothetical protein